jgi:hypothetical protein
MRFKIEKKELFPGYCSTFEFDNIIEEAKTRKNFSVLPHFCSIKIA